MQPLDKGEKESGYYFIVLEENEKVIGFCNFGPTPCTEASYDLYWIAVHKEHMNRGLGGLLLKKAEETVSGMKGKNIWVETASRELYVPTRRFYEKNGYQKGTVAVSVRKVKPRPPQSSSCTARVRQYRQRSPVYPSHRMGQRINSLR
ncbi:MAG: GNAT family N-acetyltransferase [Bacteroidales bacterium]|nr:GNAT family N-acetyltransferase [Bacteroidales bacterium]